MSLEQKFQEAYAKWQREEGKIKFTAQKNKEFYSKMGTIKIELCRFARKFENKFVDAKHISSENLEEMKKFIYDFFCKKIIQISFNIAEYILGYDDKVKNLRRNLLDIKNEVKKEYNILDLMNFFEKVMRLCVIYKSLVDSAQLSKRRKSAAVITLDFSADILKATRDFVVEMGEEIVNDKDHFYDDSDDGLLLRLLKWWDPDSYKKQVKKRDKHTLEPIPEGTKIFPAADSPKPSEVQQGEIGDCYLFAALIALAKSNPKAIKECFVQGVDKIEKEDNIKIRFFKEGSTPNTPRPFIITVDKRQVVMPKNNIRQGALWPKLIEKAYAVMRAKEGKLLEGGFPEKIMSLITGRAYRSGDIDYTMNILKNMGSLKGQQSNGSNAYVCKFKDNFITRDVKSKEDVKIYKTHAYAIVGFDESRGYVRLINPWKSGGRSEKYSPKSKEGGHIAMPIDDFKEHCFEIQGTFGASLG